MYALAVSVGSPERLEAAIGTVCGVPRDVMPTAGTPEVLARTRDGCSALVVWRDGTAQHCRFRVVEETIQASTNSTRCDAIVVGGGPAQRWLSDRATWAAYVTGALAASASYVAPFSQVDFGIGDMAPWEGIRYLPSSRQIVLERGQVRVSAIQPAPAPALTAAAIGTRLAEALAPLREERDIELSLTGGKDSRIIAAALRTAGVPFHTKTHGAVDHPDVVIAQQVARRLGVEHRRVEPAVEPATGRIAEIDVLRRLRAAVLLSDGGLSGFENTGGPDPVFRETVTIGGQGGELLRGGYAKALSGRRAVAGIEALRRLVLRRQDLLRPGARAGYATRLLKPFARVAVGPRGALDAFYAENRAGRWSAASRAMLRLRGPLSQPFFDADIYAVARALPIEARVDERVAHGVLASLAPGLMDVPFADDVWGFEKTKSPGRRGRAPSPWDWRRSDSPELVRALEEIALDVGSPGPMYEVLHRDRVAATMRGQDRIAAWSLATLAVLTSGDWRMAREPGGLVVHVRS